MSELARATFGAMTPEGLLWLTFGVGVGAAIGYAHFASLRWTVDALLGRRVAVGLLAHVARYAIVTVAFVFLARVGAAPLMGAAAGLLVGRASALRSGRSRA